MKILLFVFLCYTMTYELGGRTYVCIVCPGRTICDRADVGGWK
jgi:hypothetical protein